MSRAFNLFHRPTGDDGRSWVTTGGNDSEAVVSVEEFTTNESGQVVGPDGVIYRSVTAEVVAEPSNHPPYSAVRDWLSRFGDVISRTVITALLGVVALLAIPAGPVTVPSWEAAAVGVLALVGVAWIASWIGSWLVARYVLDAPSWDVRGWSVGRRWYGPRRPVWHHGHLASVLDWCEDGEFGGGVVVLVLFMDGLPGPAAARWVPLAELVSGDWNDREYQGGVR
jgi:hypothetical protein